MADAIAIPVLQQEEDAIADKKAGNLGERK